MAGSAKQGPQVISFPEPFRAQVWEEQTHFSIRSLGPAGSPVMRGDQLGWVPEVLFEAQLEGLANSADDILGEPFWTLQYVAGWGQGRGHQ